MSADTFIDWSQAALGTGLGTWQPSTTARAGGGQSSWPESLWSDARACGGGCGCGGCSGQSVLNGISSDSVVVGRGASTRSGRHDRINTQSGPQSTEERHESEEAERTNAVISTGRPDVIGSYVEVRESGAEDALADWWATFGEVVWGPPALSPPASGGGCVGELRGDSSCNYLASATTRPIPDLVEFAARDIPVVFSDERESPSGVDEELESLIRAAWSMLQDNISLVDWALCWVFGRRRSGKVKMACVRRQILGEGVGEVPVQMVDGVSRINAGNLAESWASIKIKIYGQHRAWQRWLTNWSCGPDDETRTCMVISVAAMLAHELVHYCGRTIDKGVIDPCGRSYMMGSVMEWALLQRYPSVGTDPAGNPTCCSSLIGEDSIFADGYYAVDVWLDCDVLTCP